MPRSSFITGVTGFVGSHLAEHLLSLGERVSGTGLKAEWDDPLIPEALRDVRIVPWDLRRAVPDQLRETLAEESPAAIYHLAAVSIPHLCGESEPTALATEVNVEGTRRVLELAESLPTRPRVLVVSSSYVYGNAGDLEPFSGGAKPCWRVDETSRALPHRGYGMTKVAAEDLAKKAVSSRGVDCVIARPFNHTGPRQTPELMLPEWCAQFAKGIDPVTVHTLNAWLDLSDVRDIVRGYRLLVDRGESGGIYNLGSGTMRRSGDLFHRLRALAGGNLEFVESRPGVKYQLIADYGRMARTTGWHPRIPLSRTIADTLEYWRQRASMA